MSRTLVAVVAAAVVLAPAAPASAAPADRAAAADRAAFAVTSEWHGGYAGAWTIRNDTAAPLTWRLEFDLAAPTRVVGSWNARLTVAGTHVTAVGQDWNATLAPGATATVGLLADGADRPTGCLLGGAPCAAGPDVRPPTAPTGLRVEGPVTGMMLLSWDASTDDVGVTGYEVWFNAGRIATVTGTSHLTPPPPPVWPAIFRVRALDAAGNASPFATFPTGGPTPPPGG